MKWIFEMKISSVEDILTLCVCARACVYFKQINIFVFNLTTGKWAFSLFRTSKEVVSYANCSFIEIVQWVINQI